MKILAPSDKTLVCMYIKIFISKIFTDLKVLRFFQKIFKFQIAGYIMYILIYNYN